LEECAEELEAGVEVDDAGFLLVEGKMGIGEGAGGELEGVGGVGLGFGEDEEVVGVANEFAAALFEFAVEVFEEEIGEQGGNGGALRNAFAEPVEVLAVPDGGFDPLADEVHDEFAGLVEGEAVEEERVVNFVKKGLDIGIDEPGVAHFVELSNAGDGAVDTAVGTVAVGAFEELVFEGLGETAGDGGLEDAVADGGDEEGAGFVGAGAVLRNTRTTELAPRGGIGCS
jgi:hypothetical protein